MSKTSWADVMGSSDNGLPTRTREVCVNPNIADEYAVLRGDLEDALVAEAKPPKEGGGRSTRLAGDVKTSRQLAEQIAALIGEHPTAFYELKFQALPREDWLALRNQHPPRDDKPGDGNMFNADTFGPAAVRACLVDPEPNDKTVAFLNKVLTAGEWEQLMLDVWSLNEGVRDVPKSVSPSLIQSGSDAD